MEQLGQKLLFTTLELEKLKSESMEEMQKNKDYINQLIHLLKYAIQERDEAQNQLQNLLNNNPIPLFQTGHPNHNPLIEPNSSVTESESSSPFDPVSSSPDSNAVVLSGDQIIDDLVKGRALPEKGGFLEAVVRAGPLLRTILVAGPLPRWRNPPRFQAFQIPPVSIRGNVGSGSMSPEAFGRVSCGSGQAQSVPLLSFGDMSSGSCLGNGMNGTCVAAPLAKRQRFI
ncbi:hypothetical protein DH2020_006975 [Rehmannia glutinosa]|uniref:Uncharacterized protein n=1 Tax=Rehmannia glutinosa TaxID=99300 RepID=A0ABR0W752_REHGL